MKIRGTFCERQLRAKRSRGTYRWKRSGKAWLLLTCPKRKRKGGCKVYKILVPAAGRKCSVGRRIVKR